MSPSTCQSGSVNYNNKGTYTTGTSTLSVPWGSHQADDIGILSIISETSPLPPSGWEFVNPPVTSSSGGMIALLTVFWKRAASGAESDVSVTGLGLFGHGQIVTYRGAASTGWPLEVPQSTNKNTLNTTTSLSGLTAVDGCSDVLYVVGRVGTLAATEQYSGEANASLVNLTEKIDGS